jgi:hypothetical protein
VPFFSTIIPVHNRAPIIRETLDSVLAQASAEQEVIVVDDGSTDGTQAVLAEYADRIKVLHQANRGPGAARNLGASQASGRYLAFLDSDDLWFPWTLSSYSQTIIEHSFPDVVVGKPQLFQALADLSELEQAPLQSEVFPDYLAAGAEWRWWGASSFVVSAAALRDVEGFTNLWVNAEDADLMLRLGTRAGFVQIKAPCTFAYREHAGTAMSNLSRTFRGALNLIDSEKGRRYPGGAQRSRERWHILTRHLRPVSLDLLERREFRQAWTLYCASLRWQLACGRWRYLLGFPMRSIRAACRTAIRSKAL